MDRTPHILIVSRDEGLEPEVRAALDGISDVRAVVSSAESWRRGLEMVRNRRPDLVLFAIGADITDLRSFVEEARTASPSTDTVAVYHPSTIAESGGKESTLLIEALRAGVSDFLRRPVSSRDLDQFMDRRLRRPRTEERPLGRIVTFFTNKGGVGKSTLSLNTACALAKRHPGRVLLVDASIQMGVCGTLLDLRPSTTMTNIVTDKERLDPTLLRELAVAHSSGLHLLASPFNALEAAMIDDDVISRVLNLGRRAFDYVIVDTFPMIDKVMMAVLDLCDRAYLVTESVVPTLEGTARMLEVLDELGFPESRRRLVLNRYSAFVGNIRSDEVERRMKFKIDHIVPYEKKVLVAANMGSPFILQPGLHSRFRKAIHRIADDIESIVPARAEAWHGNGSANGTTRTADTPVGGESA